MNKKTWLLIFVLLVFIGVYVVCFTGWGRPKIIHIISHNARTGQTAGETTVPVIFILNRPCQLTELKVVALDEWQTNKNCLPLWHLTASSGSASVEDPFAYGENIDGMNPAVPGAQAQPLRPGVKYRLFVTDGSAKGEHDFQTAAAR